MNKHGIRDVIIFIINAKRNVFFINDVFCIQICLSACIHKLYIAGTAFVGTAFSIYSLNAKWWPLT